ncbi:hypothetical protein FFZ77_10010 [Streptomyces katsurahamanus]|uniref:Integrase n=1 Tax=Streptomyces katsurahamanus TaxID=2577098 RepID=A0ABW9NRH5_9ACTN|nr:hypothetical protein [Streptomyces katsurahamanus]
MSTDRHNPSIWTFTERTSTKALTIGRSPGYALAKQDEYPVTVLRLGNAYRVVTADLHRLLGVTAGAVTPDTDPGP